MKTRALAFLAIAAVAALAACSDWRYNVTLGSVAYTRVKIDRQGFTIGMIAHDTSIGNRLCKQGWVHIHPNGVLAAFTAADPIVMPTVTVPVDTWVHQDPYGRIIACAFPRPTNVQGYWCAGTGGATGVRTAFYPEGALKVFFPLRPVFVDGVQCHASLFNGWVELHEDGRLSSCVLETDLVRDGQIYRKGTRLYFGPRGNVLPKSEMTVDYFDIGG